MCSRCAGRLVPPGPYDSTWRCAVHGSVPPLKVLGPGGASLRHACRSATVPVWLPDPVPVGWTHTGSVVVGAGRSGFCAVVNAFGLPHPLGGDAEILLAAEEAHVGSGAVYAGLAGASGPRSVDVPSFVSGPVTGHVTARERPTAMWSVPGSDDRAAFVGEAGGVWLWLVVFPAEAAFLLLDGLELVDARDGLPVVPAGTASPRLRLPASTGR